MISSSLDQTEGLEKSDDRVNKPNYTPLEETLRPMWKLVRLNHNINFFDDSKYLKTIKIDNSLYIG